MMTSTVPVKQARQHLGELIEQAHYLGRPFVLTRAKKPMAAIIGSNELARMLELVETYDPGLADTLAIITNPDIEVLLAEGEKAIQKGDVSPFDEGLLDD
jgi:PHD/YefM family antitoxin component YafN of YafNO toxin-antitoxin module